MLTTYDADEDIARALEAGAKAYILKDIAADALVACIHDVLAGKTYLAPAAAAKLAERVTQVQLTPRELGTLRLMADGHSNKEIASALVDQRADGQDPSRAPVRKARRHQPHRGGAGRHPSRSRPPRLTSWQITRSPDRSTDRQINRSDRPIDRSTDQEISPSRIARV